MNKKDGPKKQRTKKELLEELTALRQELENVQSTQAEMKKDQEAQGKKGDFFFNIFSAIQEGISVLDPELNILFINPTIERWIPHDLPLVGRKCYEAYHGRSQRCEVCPCYETLQTGQIANEIIPVLDTKGEISGWSHHFSYPLLDSQTGRMIGVIEYIRNITEQKQTKEALTVSEEKHRSILQNLADGYFEVDLTGNLTFFNEALEKIFDYSRDELMGMNNRLYSDEENALKIYQIFNRVYRTGEPAKGIRFETIEKNKSIKNLELSISLARNDSGNPIGFRGFARDITDLIQIQNSLKTSEERYRTIIETMEDAYFEVDLTGNFTFFNEAMFRIMGYPTDKMMGTNFQQYTDAENAQKLFEAFSRVYQTGEPIRNIQYSAFNKNGVIKNIITSVSLIRDSSEKPVGFRGISKDITDLIKIQTALQESEERYRTIIETIEDGYAEVDLSGKFTFVNEAMVRILEYPRPELMGMNNRQYTDDTNAKILFKNFNRVYQTGEPSKGIRYEGIAKGNKKKNIEVSISLIRDASGNPIGFRGISRDITDLIQSHKALQESEERYRTIIETLVDGYYEVDLTGTFTFINDSMVRILGYPKAELLSMNNRKYTYQEYHKPILETFNRVYQTGEPFSGIQYEVFTKKGDRKFVETSVSLIRDSGRKPVGFRGIVRDITELKQAQKAVQASEERFRIAAQSSYDFIYEWDLESGQIEWFGTAVEKLTEFFGELPVTGAAFDKLIYPEDRDRIVEAIQRHLKQGIPYREEYRLIGKTGGISYAKAAGMGLRNDKGRVYKWIGVINDITEGKKAEQALQTSEERFRIAAESTNDFIYEWDLKTGQYDWFGMAVEKLRNSLGELPTNEKIYERMIHPEDLERISNAARLLISQGMPFLEEYRMIGNTGNIMHMKDAAMCLRSGKGTAYKWIGAISDITDRKRTEEELKQSFEKVRKAMGGIIQAVALTVESKDPYTAGHQQRVSSLARTIAQEMGLSKDQVEAIRLAGVVHDLGKISVPAEILSKPTKLSDLEFSLIKGHSQTSYEILKDIDFPWPIARIALQHHERMNGSGYPAGLKGDEIQIEAQVLMVADVVEAIASHRPYRAALGIDLALEEISKNKGELFNPAAVEACLRLFREKGFSWD